MTNGNQDLTGEQNPPGSHRQGSSFGGNAPAQNNYNQKLTDAYSGLGGKGAVSAGKDGLGQFRNHTREIIKMQALWRGNIARR